MLNSILIAMVMTPEVDADTIVTGVSATSCNAAIEDIFSEHNAASFSSHFDV